jgi:hypothetical protein
MKRQPVFAVILSLGFIISSLIVSWTLYHIKTFDQSLQVIGSAKQQVTSDWVKWDVVFSRPVTMASVKSGNELMKADLAKVLAFFKKNGFSEDMLTVSAVTMEQLYNENSKGPTQYMLRQHVEVQSKDVQKITRLSKDAQTLVENGVVLSSGPVEYFYSKLPELRVSLLKGATLDAMQRANSIAKSSGQKVGPLKAASAGVVQVLSLNSMNVSDYGTYDTSHIEKEVMVSVKATFVLK